MLLILPIHQACPLFYFLGDFSGKKESNQELELIPLTVQLSFIILLKMY